MVACFLPSSSLERCTIRILHLCFTCCCPTMPACSALRNRAVAGDWLFCKYFMHYWLYYFDKQTSFGSAYSLSDWLQFGFCKTINRLARGLCQAYHLTVSIGSALSTLLSHVFQTTSVLFLTSFGLVCLRCHH